jgi:hypothetical protein
MKSSNKKVNAFLLDIETELPDKSTIVEKIRQIFFDENAALEEDIKYGGIVFTISGELIGGIFLYKQHISIEFSHGASFDDESNLLEGKGKLRRHLKIREKSDLKDKKVSAYIKQAVQP